MSGRSKIFLAGDTRYHADTCAALVAAHRAGEVAFRAVARGSYPGRRLPAATLPQLSSLGYWDAAHNQSWGLSEHRNEGVEVTYLANGHLDFRVHGSHHPLGPGQLTITRPWQPHSVGDPQIAASRLYWLILDVGVRQPHQAWTWPAWLVLARSDLRALTTLLRENERPVWPGTPEIARCFEGIGRLLDDTAGAAIPVSRLAVAINELVVCLHELLRAQNPPRRPGLTLGERSAAMFFDSLATSLDQPWTLELMAARSGLGRTRLAHYCRKLTNLTPLAYLQHLRIERARQLLADDKRSITAIALDCGFGSSAYFSHVFRVAMRRTPRQFREECRAQPDPGGNHGGSG